MSVANLVEIDQVVNSPAMRRLQIDNDTFCKKPFLNSEDPKTDISTNISKYFLSITILSIYYSQLIKESNKTEVIIYIYIYRMIF